MFFREIFQKITKIPLVFVPLRFGLKFLRVFVFPWCARLDAWALRPFILFAPGADQIPLQTDCKTPLGGYVGLCGVVLYSLGLCFG